MPNKHKHPYIGWNPPAELSQWARAEAERRGVPLSQVLNEALEHERERVMSETAAKGEGR